MNENDARRRLVRAALLAVAAGAAGCGLPGRLAVIPAIQGRVEPLRGFEDVRAVDGYASDEFQRSFDRAVERFAATPLPADGRRDFDMLVLSSGGVNGAFGAGILTAWTERGDRPLFWTVTGVSVGALLAPFAFAGPEYDDRIERLFRFLEPKDLHRDKGVLASVLWDESLTDNTALRKTIRREVDASLLQAVAQRHAEGRRCWVGSANLDLGHFCVWDLGAIAARGTPEALELFRNVLIASAAIPVIYPPVRFGDEERNELHVDGAVVRPLFIPQNIFDGELSAERAGLAWDDVDATLYVVQNGSLRPCPVEVQRETLAIATRTLTMMSYTMVSEHVLHLYLLAQAWEANFRFHALPDGLELEIDSFGREDTNRLYLLGRGLMERREPWRETPPGYVLRADLNRTQVATETPERGVADRLDSMEREIRALRDELREALGK
ncbi:MAG: patatin-like phospholipase family protein [Planctomycetota bacterium]